MNVFGSVLKYIVDGYVYGTSPLKASTQGPFRNFFRSVSYGAGNAATADAKFYLQLAATNPNVLACIRLIADRLTGEDLFIVQERSGDEWKDIQQHPLPKLIARPNAVMPGSLLISDTTWWYSLMGNGYWLLRTPQPGQGVPREIWPIPANLITPEPSTLRHSPITGQVVIDYRYQLTGDLLPGENVLHFRTANPFDYWIGLAHLSALIDNIATFAEKKGWLKSFFGPGNAVPTAVISVPPTLDDPTFDAVVASIEEQFGGGRRTAVIRSGDMTVQPIMQTMAEMQVVDSFKMDKDEVYDVFGVPTDLRSGASGVALLAAETAFARNVIQPILNDMAAFINLRTIHYYGDPANLRVVAKNTIPQDRALDIQELAAQAPYRTVNENRKKLNEPALTFGGELAALQVLLDQVPVAQIPLIAPLLIGKMQAPAAQDKGRVVQIINDIVGGHTIPGQASPVGLYGSTGLPSPDRLLFGPDFSQSLIDGFANTGKGWTEFEIVAAMYAMLQGVEARKGGSGSGNFGHEGRPGERGGSSPDGAANWSGSRGGGGNGGSGGSGSRHQGSAYVASLDKIRSGHFTAHDVAGIAGGKPTISGGDARAFMSDLGLPQSTQDGILHLAHTVGTDDQGNPIYDTHHLATVAAQALQTTPNAHGSHGGANGGLGHASKPAGKKGGKKEDAPKGGGGGGGDGKTPTTNHGSPDSGLNGIAKRIQGTTGHPTQVVDGMILSQNATGQWYVIDPNDMASPGPASGTQQDAINLFKRRINSKLQG